MAVIFWPLQHPTTYTTAWCLGTVVSPTWWWHVCDKLGYVLNLGLWSQLLDSLSNPNTAPILNQPPHTHFVRSQGLCTVRWIVGCRGAWNLTWAKSVNTCLTTTSDYFLDRCIKTTIKYSGGPHCWAFVYRSHVSAALSLLLLKCLHSSIRCLC